MRITRAAKVAAFPLIVLALVALIACQGPIGPKGDKGDTGGAGTAGMDGDPGMDSTVPGPAGPAALAGLKVDAVMDNVDAGDDMDEAADMTVDLNDYFDGGAEPYTFSLKAMPSMDDFATAKLEGSMLTLKLTVPSNGFNEEGSDGYTDGKSVTIVAVDADDATAEAMVTVKPNRAPQLTGTTLRETDGALDDGDLTLGTQDADDERSNDFSSCEQFNECVLDIFTDDGDVMRSVSDPASSDHFSWALNDDGMIVLTGLVSTYDAEADSPADEPITVKVKAEDTNGLSNEVTIMLSVNKAPEMSEGAASVVRTLEVEVGSDGTGMLTTSAASLFTDFEGDARQVSWETSNTAVATVDDGTVTGVARGPVTITAKATSNEEGLEQTATIDFSVTVK